MITLTTCCTNPREDGTLEFEVVFYKHGTRYSEVVSEYMAHLLEVAKKAGRQEKMKEIRNALGSYS